MEDETKNLSGAMGTLNVNAATFVPNINAVEFVPSFLTRSQTAAENGQTNTSDFSPSKDTAEPIPENTAMSSETQSLLNPQPADSWEDEADKDAAADLKSDAIGHESDLNGVGSELKKKEGTEEGFTYAFDYNWFEKVIIQL